LVSAGDPGRRLLVETGATVYTDTHRSYHLLGQE
jgi:hypothetical protein